MEGCDYCARLPYGCCQDELTPAAGPGFQVIFYPVKGTVDGILSGITSKEGPVSRNPCLSKKFENTILSFLKFLISIYRIFCSKDKEHKALIFQPFATP